jgi:hypothetical protein
MDEAATHAAIPKNVTNSTVRLKLFLLGANVFTAIPGGLQL